jgi:hypothetical protein
MNVLTRCWLVALVASVLLSGGCVQRIGDFTIASTKNVAYNPSPDRRGVEGQHCATRLLGLIPLGSFLPNLEEAVDDAMAQVPDGNTMTNVVTYMHVWTAIIVNQQCYRVKGDVGTIQ